MLMYMELSLGVEATNEEVFPCLALVISGGHSNIYYMENPTHYELDGLYY